MRSSFSQGPGRSASLGPPVCSGAVSHGAGEDHRDQDIGRKRAASRSSEFVAGRGELRAFRAARAEKDDKEKNWSWRAPMSNVQTKEKNKS